MFFLGTQKKMKERTCKKSCGKSWRRLLFHFSNCVWPNFFQRFSFLSKNCF